MDYLLMFFACLSAIIGLIGAIVPALPGPPISYVGLIMLAFCDKNEITTTSLLVAGVMAAVVTVIDYVAPVWFTKKAGGSRAGVWGATIGLIIGLFMGILGVIVGPFLGALIGELLSDTPREKAFKVACINFVAFILTTGMKMTYSIILMVMIFVEVWNLLLN